MSEPKWIKRIQDILDNIDEIQRLLKDVDELKFYEDRVLELPVKKLLQNIGEAANHVPKDIKNKAPDLPWHEMRGMRNILVHGYDIVDEGVIWKTATEKLSDLKVFLEGLK